MKIVITLFLAFVTITSFGQDKKAPTDEFYVTGQIQKELKLSIADLLKYKSTPIGDIIITNHLGEKKGTATKLAGIPIKELLKDLLYNVESPKQLSEFYFVLVAADNYKVVYSWNELFNTATGDNTYLIVEKDGKTLPEMDDRLLLVTKTDFKTGRRFVKGLSKIIVQRVP